MRLSKTLVRAIAVTAGLWGLACSSGTGSGGSSGGGSGGTGQTGGDASASTGANGSSGTGGDGSSATGGEGGVCPGAATTTACEQCEAEKCCQELTACTADKQCLELEACAFACGYTVGVTPTPAVKACVARCEDEYPEGTAGGPLVLFECVATKCGVCN
jgi:hypothetical protein